jgi:hypothetical protein
LLQWGVTRHTVEKSGGLSVIIPNVNLCVSMPCKTIMVRFIS